MAGNIVNGRDLDNYLSDVVYRGEQKEVFNDGNFNSIDFVEQHKDEIVCSMLMKWANYCLKPYMSTKTPKTAIFLPLINVTERNLPDWAEKRMKAGEYVYRFKADRIPDSMKEKITMARDYLYAASESYINKIITRAKDTQEKYAQNPNAKGDKNQQKPRIRMDYLKTAEEYADFDKVVQAAKQWHEKIAADSKFRKYDAELYKESLEGTKPIMELGDGMRIVQLLTKKALDFESDYMGHCVGKGGYDSGIKDGSVKIYSLRDEYGEPHATFEVKKGTIKQCKGKQDKAPEAKYRPYIQQFVRAKKLAIGGDFKSICLIKYHNEYYDLFNLPKDKKIILNGDLDISDMGLTELPDLSNLIVKGSFFCNKNKLSNLLGSPLQVLKDYDCRGNNLTSLLGISSQIGSLVCSHNQLTSLEYAPETVYDLCCECNQLRDFGGAPKNIKNMLKADLNPIVSFAGFPDKVNGDFRAINNDLENVEDIADRVKGSIFIYNPKKEFFMVKQQGKLINLLEQPEGYVYHGYIDISNCGLEKLPNFSKISIDGDLYCEENLLTSFVNAPKEVSGIFHADFNPVRSLEGLSKKVGMQLDLSGCDKLRTLKGISEEVDGMVMLYGCSKLKNLDYLPQKGCIGLGLEKKLLKKYNIAERADMNSIRAAIAKYNAGLIAAAKTKE